MSDDNAIIYYIKSIIENTLKKLDFIENYHIEVEKMKVPLRSITDEKESESKLKIRIWIVNHRYTVHILSGGDKIEKIIKNKVGRKKYSLDIYSRD